MTVSERRGEEVQLHAARGGRSLPPLSCALQALPACAAEEDSKKTRAPSARYGATAAEVCCSPRLRRGARRRREPALCVCRDAAALTHTHCVALPQDADYPAQELLTHSPNTRGWQCERCGAAALRHAMRRCNPKARCLSVRAADAPRVRASYCAYPQEITLRLEVPARVQQIQILSHEYKARRTDVRTRLLLSSDRDARRLPRAWSCTPARCRWARRTCATWSCGGWVTSRLTGAWRGALRCARKHAFRAHALQRAAPDALPTTRARPRHPHVPAATRRAGTRRAS